jgi:hypothetical protein
MNVPAMYYVGCAFNWFFVLLTIGGYFYILSKTGKKWGFMLIFASTWIIMGLSYVFLINGVSSNEWYITLIRIIGYILFLATILGAVFELAMLKKPE